MLGGEIGGFAFGEAEEELENIGSVPVTPWAARFFQGSWACMFAHYGADIVYRRNVEGGDAIRIGTKAFFRPLLDKEMVGDIRASDVGVLIDPAPLKLRGLPWPPLQGDMIVRRAGKDEETLYAAVAPPQTIDVNDVDIVVRMIARSGSSGS